MTLTTKTNKTHYSAGKSSEWFTPPMYIAAARHVMAGIDLDPASCEAAQVIVKAAQYFTRADDGLAHDWHGTVWLNPPYSDYRGQANAWVRKALSEFLAGRVRQAILLVNASTCYQRAMQDALMTGSACFSDRRIQFLDESGTKMRQPPQSNVFIYLGNRHSEFSDCFSQFGAVLMAPYRGRLDMDNLCAKFEMFED